MKKIVSVIVIIVLVLISASSLLRAESVKVEGEELIENGNFPFNSGELHFGDPVFGSSYGPARNYGSLGFDSHVIAVADPSDSTNTVLKFSYSEPPKAWSSFFKLTPGVFTVDTTYTISVDYYVEGTTDNFGFRFAPGADKEFVFWNQGEAIDGKDGWRRYQQDLVWNTGKDSIASWFNTGSNTANIGYMDNLLIWEKSDATKTNLNTGGDFEGFLDYAPSLTLVSEPNQFNFYGQGTYGNGTLYLGDTDYFGYKVDLAPYNYLGLFDFEVKTGASTISVFYKFVGTEQQMVIIDNGVLNADYAIENEGSIYVNFDYELLSDALGIEIHVTNGSLELHDMSLKYYYFYDDPFDPDKTYYPQEEIYVNGDFEAIPLDTVFSEVQQEGAWGSVSLDNPATIKEVNGSHVMALGKGSKTYSSSFVMTDINLEVGELIRFGYDYKLELADSITDYNAINSTFVGAANEGYFTLNLKNIDTNKMTTGAEAINFKVVVTPLENGWVRVEFDFQVTMEMLLKTNSVRWLFTARNEGDFFYVDNVSMKYLSTNAPADPSKLTKLSIDQDDLTLNEGDTKQLTYTRTPSGNTDAVTWVSSNPEVATVSTSGLVTAVSKGAAEISLKNADNTISDVIIVTVIDGGTNSGPEGGLQVWQIVLIAVGSVAVVGGAAFCLVKFVFKKKK